MSSFKAISDFNSLLDLPLLHILEKMQEGVSVIISTFNGVSRLKNTLEALSKQEIESIASIEVLLIDNASTDNTSDFSQNLWYQLGNPFELKVIYEPNPGKINAQNTGLANAQYDVVLICDDDNALFPDYIENGYKLFLQNPQIGALGGRGIAVSDVSIPDWFDEVAYMFACAPQAKKTGDVRPERNVIYGAGMFINMRAFNKARAAGFKYLLPSRIGKSLVTGAEDGEVCWWLRFAGYEIWYAENLVFYHHLPAGRLTQEYRERLSNTLQIGFPVGKLYLRIFSGELTKPIKLFWLKEAVYTLLYIPTIPFLKIKNKGNDFKRSINQIIYFLKERSEYDNTLRDLLAIREKLKNG